MCNLYIQEKKFHVKILIFDVRWGGATRYKIMNFVALNKSDKRFIIESYHLSLTQSDAFG